MLHGVLPSEAVPHASMKWYPWCAPLRYVDSPPAEPPESTTSFASPKPQSRIRTSIVRLKLAAPRNVSRWVELGTGHAPSRWPVKLEPSQYGMKTLVQLAPMP